MRRSFLLLCMLTTCFSTGLAQAPALNWDEVYYTGQGTNIGKRVLVGPDTAVYTLGEGGNFCYLAKYRSYDGQPQWGTQWDSATVAVDLALHPAGMVVAAWVFYNEPFNTPLDIGVSAYDLDGTPLWTFHWNDSLDRDDIVSDLHIDSNGDILLCATTEEVSGNPIVFNNISTLKLDASGNLLWRRTWNGALNNDDEPNAVWTDAANNVYVAGYTTNAGLNAQDMVLLKYDASGTFQWSQAVNRNSGFGSHIDIATHVRTNPSGNIIMAGITESPGSNFGEDFSLYAYNPNGGLLWQYHYNNQNEEEVMDMDIDAQGRVHVLGRISSNGGNGQVLFRVDNNGALDWAAVNATTAIGPPFPHALALSPDGNTITTGMVGDQLLRDAYVHAVDSNGVALWTYRYTSTNSFNEEEGHDVTVGSNRAIYMSGMYDQNGQSFIRGLTLCLCPEEEGVCLLDPTVEPVFQTNEMTGADLDQDGWRDIVFTTPLQNTLGVYMGGPSGFTLTFPVSVPGQPTLLANGDVDQDGDIDVVAGILGTEDLWLVTNNGGTLAYSSTLPTVGGVVDYNVTDVDSQNGPDVVAVMNAAPFLTVFLNNGNGTFGASNPATVPNPYRIANGDVDGNGTVDLLIGRVVADSIYVLHGNGNGTFSAPDGFVSGIAGPAMVGIGDFTFDGINDLVTCNGTSSWGVRPGTGGGNFGAAITGNAGAVNEFIVAPFAQDTTMRILTGNYGSTNVVSYSTCSFTYPNTTLASTPAGNHLVEVADWTNDGSPDILSYYTGGEVRIWRNCDTLGIGLVVPQSATMNGAEELMVFPSPTTGQSTVVRPTGAEGPATISVCSLGGQVLQQWNSSALVQTIDLSAQPEGVYVVHYRTMERAWTARVVKVK